MGNWRRGVRRAQPSVEARIERALQSVRPLLHSDEFTVEFVEFEPETGVAVLRFAGDCPDCEMSASMLRQGVEAHLRAQVPEVARIRPI